MAEDLLRRVADELDIRDVIYRLGMLADGGDLDEYASLFTEDGMWEMRGKPAGAADIPPIRGRANLLAGAKKRRADGVQGPGTHKYHCLLTTTIRLNGDKADAKSYFAYVANANTKPDIAVFAIYNDELVRTKDGWKVAARHIDPA
jgi:hypothetical protein